MSVDIQDLGAQQYCFAQYVIEDLACRYAYDEPQASIMGETEDLVHGRNVALGGYDQSCSETRHPSTVFPSAP